MTRIPSLMMMALAMVLAVLGATAVIAQQPDKYAVQVPNGLSLSAFRGYEGWEVVSVARLLSRQGDIVAVETNRYFVRATVTDLVTRLARGMSAGGDYGPAELREFLGLTRKFLIPFLEYCDREGYTIRDGLGRRRKGTDLAS